MQAKFHREKSQSPQRSSVSLCIRTLSPQTHYLFKVPQSTREQRNKSREVLWNKALHFFKHWLSQGTLFHTCVYFNYLTYYFLALQDVVQKLSSGGEDVDFFEINESVFRHWFCV